MTKRVAIRGARDADIDLMLPHIREPDIAEMWAAGRYTPEYALRQGLAQSDATWTGIVNDEIVCMFGVSAGSILGGIGVPWMIGTHAIDRHAASFVRHSRGALLMMQSRYEYLVNFVDDRNEAAKRWLGWLGFTIEEPRPFGPYRLPFRLFWMSRFGGPRNV